MALDKNEIEILKTKLNTKIDRARVKIDRMRDMAQPIGPENAIGRVSRMDAINNKSVMEAALRSAEEDLSQMETALHKLENGEPLGICEKCGQQIPFQRLALMPGSTKCVRCA